jgi:small subunit ribosomal protein S14
MAKKSLIKRNARRIKISSSCKAKRDKLKKTIKDLNVPFNERLLAQIKLSEMVRDASKVRVRNRCALTGRPRGNLRKFGISRIAVRELASWGQIPGLIKSSW